MSPEPGATVTEQQAPFPAVWFMGMERAGDWLPW